MFAINEKIQTTFKDLRLVTVSPLEADNHFSEINCWLADHSLDEALQWSLSTFGDKVALVTSFGPTGMVILDRLAKLSPGIKVITLDTDFLFAETYALREQVQRRYPIQLEIHKSGLTPAAQAEVYGPKLWQTNPDLCCHLRKVAPLTEALAGLDAWITGLRRDQASTRAEVPIVAWDYKYGLLKINPLAGWTRAQVWTYLLENKVPYNHLHDQGYSSIGCVHCTRPANHPADERAGRWQGSNKIECGIHLS